MIKQMKNKYLLFFTVIAVYLTSCTSSPIDKVQSSVQSYLKENLKNAATYAAISFSQLDTLKIDHTKLKELEKLDIPKAQKELFFKQLKESENDLYKITHTYSIVNSDKEKVTMKIAFYLDKDLKVSNLGDYKGIDGDFGTFTGNAYWKYNDYVGDRADAGADIS